MSENRLGRETSPYLLQHKDNPVHWWAWGEEAIAEAKRTKRPILLSVGYAACHWCHVMAHESFEDEATAAVMNELFVNIKVDREERPDIDAIYMGALHRLGEHGGWPLTMFLDSEARPFWGGTYFPKGARFGKPAFVHVLREISRIYTTEPERVAHNAETIVAALGQHEAATDAPRISDASLADLTSRMVTAVDPVHGGLAGAPKFPQWSFFWLLWRGAIRFDNAAARHAVENTLAHICQGGIYDHLGGGFARYSVDARWLVPHFEKMLYDNALLIDLMTEVFRETHHPLLQRRIEETVAWLMREMISEGGGFAASLDADSEGEEGKFYVWSAAEIEEVLGDDAPLFGEVYDLTSEGNWEGHTILNRLSDIGLESAAQEAKLADLRDKLLHRRTKRVRPGWDDKVLADWNGLMIAALVHASRVFERPDWLQLAQNAFAFVDSKMQRFGRLIHAYRRGQGKAPATASDYANMIWGALRLFQASNDAAYLTAAEGWVEVLERHYRSTQAGGYAITADDTPDVIVRLRSGYDDATPNANAIMISNLVQLSLLTGKQPYFDRAHEIPRAFGGDLGRSLLGHCGLLAGIYDLIAPQQVLVLGQEPEVRPLIEALRSLSLPGAIEQILTSTSDLPSTSPLNGKAVPVGQAAAFACIGTRCSLPITDTTNLRKFLRAQRQAST
jgi:uncharacterized protein YyaL (SSP411 family)